MKKTNRKVTFALIGLLALLLFGCGGLTIWIDVTVPLPVIEISLVDEISLTPSLVTMETGEKFKSYDSVIHVALTDEAKDQIGNRQITDLEISVNASLTSTYASPIHVELYLSDSTITSQDDLSNQDLVWQGDIQAGLLISETLNLTNSPGLHHVIDILNSSNREGDLYVAIVHNYPETDPATVTFDITVTRVRLTLF